MSATNWNHIDKLAKKAITGDQKCYREFLELVRDYVQTKVFLTVSSSSRDDVIQEILLGIHKSLRTLDTSKSCRSWVNAIAHYKVSDYLRQIYKDNTSELEDEKHESIDFDSTEFRQLLDHISTVLSDKEMNIFMKLKYEGYSIAEVSKEVGLSESNIKVISFRAIKKIREFIMQEEFYEK